MDEKSVPLEEVDIKTQLGNAGFWKGFVLTIEWVKTRVVGHVKNYSSNIAALYMLVLSVYPSATPETIILSFHDGTWKEKAGKLLLAYFFYRFGK